MIASESTTPNTYRRKILYLANIGFCITSSCTWLVSVVSTYSLSHTVLRGVVDGMHVCFVQSSSVTVPNAADLFGEEDTDGAPMMSNGSTSSTPRASLQTETSRSLKSPPHSTLQGTTPIRPANTYENTPVSPASLPVDASSVSLACISFSLNFLCMKSFLFFIFLLFVASCRSLI